jgi:hypothetical protein
MEIMKDERLWPHACRKKTFPANVKGLSFLYSAPECLEFQRFQSLSSSTDRSCSKKIFANASKNWVWEILRRLNFVFIFFHWFQFWELPEYFSWSTWQAANKKALILLHSQLLTKPFGKWTESSLYKSCQGLLSSQINTDTLLVNYDFLYPTIVVWMLLLSNLLASKNGVLVKPDTACPWHTYTHNIKKPPGCT